MSYGGDGAGDRPQQPPHRIDSTCESGIGHFAFDNIERIMQRIRNNTKHFTHFVGYQVRFTVLPCYPSWTEVPEEQRARLRSIIEIALAVDRYRYYKLKVHNHLKAHRTQPIIRTICLPRTGRSALTSSPVLLSWDGPRKIRHIEEMLNTRACKGSNNFSATCYDEVQLNFAISLYKSSMHYVTMSTNYISRLNFCSGTSRPSSGRALLSRSGLFIPSEMAIGKTHRRLVTMLPPVVHRWTSVLLQRRFSENDEVTSVGLTGSEEHISLPRFYRCIEAPQRTFHQFSGDPHSDDHRFAIYKAQLRRMQREIELLKNSILVVVPEEEDNEDTDEGL
ncbi:hypothetical protein Adt_33706 [Abeliophyllum distichum]|uniref:Uncharacterized protein n=1 Tax=Abeliophyllum distichum TaxID=126358 RepID=A0ABD1QX05_9LAMI